MAAASWFGNIEPFRKGGNWSAFVQQLEAFSMLNNIAADKKAALLLTQVSQEVFAEIPAICETETPLSLTYEALKEKLESHYQPKPNQQLQRFSFRARKQGRNESIRDFVTALRSLALKCQFQTNEINSQLKDQLITGVYNQRVRYELLKASADESFENLLRLAKTVELADAKAASLGTPNVVNTGSTPDNNTTVAQDADIHTIQTGRNRTATNRGRGNFYGQASRRGWSAPRGGGRGQQRSQNQQSQGAGRTAGSERICFCCGGTNHIKANCSLQNKYCSECGNQGHIFKMCRRAGRGGQTRNQNYVGDGETAETQEHLREEFSEDEERFASDFWPVRESGNVEYELKKKVNPQFVTIKVNNIPLKMEIDSGAGVSAISKNCYEKWFAEIPLITSKISLRTYDKQKLPPLGYIQVEAEKNCVKSKELLYVVSEGSWPIMGRSWLQAFGMWPLVFPNDPREHINSTIAQTGDDDVTKRKQITCQLQKEFPGVFAAGIGTFTKGELKLTLIEGATPKFLQPRKMPWALRDKVENELARLQQLAIISPVEYSDWGTPIVPVLKSNGTLRLCGDYKVTLNKYLEVDRYPLPRVEEVLETLRGGKIFTKLDLSEAYQQLPLTQESQKLVVISTHIGLFKYHRLPYGVATGPGSFQRVMTSLLLGIPGTIVFIDDILITAATLEIHTDRVREVLKRLNEGEAKIKSVKDAPKPKDVSELRSFLGSINYYGRFIENMAQKLRALYECLEKDKFEWTEVCDKTFEKIKRELVSDKILAHFDPQKQTVLTCDASPYGISAVLAHRDEEAPEYVEEFLQKFIDELNQFQQEGMEVRMLVNGVRSYSQPEYHNGPSPLLRIELPIDMIRCILLDFQHLGCHGAMKKLAESWYSGDLNVKMGPREREELSRRMESLSTQNILSEDLYDHFLLLHVAFRILSSEELLQKYKDQAKKYLKSFCLTLTDLYRLKALVINMHNLIHIVDDVEFMKYLQNSGLASIPPMIEILCEDAEQILSASDTSTSTDKELSVFSQTIEDSRDRLELDRNRERVEAMNSEPVLSQRTRLRIIAEHCYNGDIEKGIFKTGEQQTWVK
ncbi:uncharacterized protein LOC124294411 [Neodiprion lecontei]|uniref:Uncharacterized protein LOC124294411 n=1 Tax=Neodiprion lecontei TaxID=441921 RepID=A0ABM3G4Y2_NEOLC|nr:uncharacterized protein LOC124294411 [Neodiprion lecontei]